MSNKHISEQELQDWLDAVHFSSSCNLPIEDKQEQNKSNKVDTSDAKQDKSKE